MRVIDSPGIYADLDERTYHGDAHLAPHLGRSLSATGAKTILDCPARYHWERSHPVHKDAFDVGTLAHELRRRGGGWGLAAICIGVGQGLAVVLHA